MLEQDVKKEIQVIREKLKKNQVYTDMKEDYENFLRVSKNELEGKQLIFLLNALHEKELEEIYHAAYQCGSDAGVIISSKMMDHVISIITTKQRNR